MALYWSLPTNFQKLNMLMTYNWTFYTYIIGKGEKVNVGGADRDREQNKK